MSLPVWEVTWYFSIPSWTSHKPSEDVSVNVWHALKTQEGNHLRLKSWDKLVPVPVSHTASCLLSGTKKPQKITRTHRNSILISVTSHLMALLILQWSPTPMKFHVSSSSTHPSVHPSVRLSVQAPGSHFPWDGVGGSCSDADSFWCGGAAVLQALYGWDSGGSSHRPPVSHSPVLVSAHSSQSQMREENSENTPVHHPHHCRPFIHPSFMNRTPRYLRERKLHSFPPFPPWPCDRLCAGKNRIKHTLVSMWSLTLQDETSEELLLLSLWVFKSIMLHRTWFNLFKLQDYTLQFILISVRLPNKYQLLSEL